MLKVHLALVFGVLLLEKMYVCIDHPLPPITPRAIRKRRHFLDGKKRESAGFDTRFVRENENRQSESSTLFFLKCLSLPFLVNIPVRVLREWTFIRFCLHCRQTVYMRILVSNCAVSYWDLWRALPLPLYTVGRHPRLVSLLLCEETTARASR